MCLGYMQVWHHKMTPFWASVDFGIHGMEVLKPILCGYLGMTIYSWLLNNVGVRGPEPQRSLKIFLLCAWFLCILDISVITTQIHTTKDHVVLY